MRVPRDQGPDGLISSVFTVPNLVSAFRILLVPIFAWSLLEGQRIEPVIIFFIAGISDLFDGFIARHLHQRSRLGAILDPAGDKLLMAASYILLAIPNVAVPNRIPVWLTIIVFGRDLMISGGVFWAFLTYRIKPVLPMFIGKLTTAFQIGTVFLVLVTNYTGNPAAWMVIFYAITAGLTLVSWALYFLRGLRLLRERRPA
ncbi:MAG: CDP-alcohol phosphatidyltransferase family protein [Candidatus Aminicenantes bacterium]|nr:CDP-alcohol phosphatidyltransferase family protein [Candidatus Aminicenantes bacterium]